jgi:haloacetate dehalogenase
MPVLSLWGSKGNTGSTVKDLLAIWQERALLPVQGGPLPCGHYVPEEAPDQVVDWFMRFFGQ